MKASMPECTVRFLCYGKRYCSGSDVVDDEGLIGGILLCCYVKRGYFVSSYCDGY